MPDAAVEERARARVGQTLNGKYRLERLLGVGGMAAVYAATHRNKKQFAVKVLHQELSVHPGLRTRFMREGYVANSVDHRGAVAVIDDDVAEDGSAFLVMELLHGAPVDAVCDRRGGKLAPRHVLAIAEQLLDVLAAADAKNIVHRDIKPANVFVTRDGQVKVLDFGVARLRDPEGPQATHSGLALGTPAFMAPEQALGRSDEIGGRTDVWAVGATMLSLLTGRSVHEGSSAQEQMVLAATRPATSLATLSPEVPPEIVAVVDKALAFAQSDRWQHASEMREAVRAAYEKLFGEPPSAAVLASIATDSVRPASAEAPSDPLALTVAAPGWSTDRGAMRSGGPVSPQATSLAGTSARAGSTVTAAGRVRVAVGATVLVLAGAAAGAWIAMRRDSGTPPAPSFAASASSVVPVQSSSPAPSTTPEAPAPVPSPSASSTASSSPAPVVVPPPSSATPQRPRPARPAPTPAPTPDSFDRQ